LKLDGGKCDPEALDAAKEEVLLDIGASLTGTV
jgi:hypothetical protein